MTTKTLFLAAAAVAAVAAAPLAASAATITYEGSTYTVDTPGTGSGSFSGNTVFEIPVASSDVMNRLTIQAGSTTEFLEKAIDGSTYEGGTPNLSVAVTGPDGALYKFYQPLTATGDWKVFVKFGSGTGGSAGGTYSLGPIPEPATWAMMLVGVAAVGGAMRRRARLATAA
jgi:hypothetical protein